MEKINLRDLIHVSLLPHGLVCNRSIVCKYILKCLCFIVTDFEQSCTKFKPQGGEEDVVLHDKLNLSRELVSHLIISQHLYSNSGHQVFQTQTIDRGDRRQYNNDNHKNESTTSASVNGVTQEYITPSTFTRDVHRQDIFLPGGSTLTSPPQKEVGNQHRALISPRKKCDLNASERQCSQESLSAFDTNPFSSCSSGSADNDPLRSWCSSIREPTPVADSRSLSTNSSVDDESVGAPSPGLFRMAASRSLLANSSVDDKSVGSSSSSPFGMAVSQSLSTNSNVDDESVVSSSSGLSSSNTKTDDEQHDAQTQPSFLDMLRSVLNNDVLQTLSELDISDPLYFLSAARGLYSKNKAHDDTSAMLFQMQLCATSLHFIPASKRHLLLGIQKLPCAVDKFFLLTSQIVRRHRSLFLSPYKEYEELGVGTVFQAIGFEFYLLKTLLETQYSYELGGRGFQFDDIICFMITALVAADNISIQEENIDKEVKDVGRYFRQKTFNEYNMLPPNDKYSFQFVGFAFIQFFIGDVYDGVDTLEVIECGVPSIADWQMFSTLIIQAAVDGDDYTNGAGQPPPQTMMVPQDQEPRIQQHIAAATQSFATTAATASPQMHATTGQSMFHHHPQLPTVSGIGEHHPQLNHHSYGHGTSAATQSFATTAATASPQMHATTGQSMFHHHPQLPTVSGIGEHHPQLNHHSYGHGTSAATPSHFATTASIASPSPRMHATTGQSVFHHQPQLPTLSDIGEHHSQLNHHSYGHGTSAATPSHFATTASIASPSPWSMHATDQPMVHHQSQLSTVSDIGGLYPQLNHSASAPPEQVGLNNWVGGATTMATSATMYPQVTNGVPSVAFGLHPHQPQMNMQASQGSTASDEPAGWSGGNLAHFA